MEDKELQYKPVAKVGLDIATGDTLDIIGCNIYEVYRRYGESDQSYRTRIMDCRRAILLNSYD